MRDDSSLMCDSPPVRRIVSLYATMVLALVAPCSAADLYLQTSIDQAGRLHIVRNDGREIVPKKEADQVGVDKVAISEDGRSVGWGWPCIQTAAPLTPFR